MARSSAKQAKAAARPEAVSYAPLPNVIKLTKQTAGVLWRNKELLGGIAVVYILLTLLFVRGLGTGSNVAELRDQFSSQVAGSVATYFQLLGNSGGSSGQAGAYQFFLFILVSLAAVWALRQIYAQQKPSVKDAYYRGMYPLVPYLLVLVVIMVQLLPVIIGVSVYQLVVVSGIAASSLEVSLWALLALVLALVSIYFLAASIIALYIVTLPNMGPLQALRSARQLVRGRRWTVLRKMLFFPLVLVVAGGVVMVPFILVVPVVAGWLLFLLGCASVVAGHAYFYNLYHGLLNEQPAK